MTRLAAKPSWPKQWYVRKVYKNKFTIGVKNYSVLEATFIQSIKEQTLVEKVYYDIFELGLDNAKNSSDFKLLLLDDTDKFFSILTENLSVIFNNLENPESLQKFEKILGYIQVVFEHILLYESSHVTYSNYKNLVDCLVDGVINNKKTSYIKELEKFITENIQLTFN